MYNRYRFFLLTLVMGFSLAAQGQGPLAQQGQRIACTDDTALDFACTGIDLLAVVTPRELGAAPGISLNDIWGWTDPETGKEYALVGRTDGTAFVDISDPLNPVYVGELPKHADSQTNIWRDVKVYADHAYIVADGAGWHGMQVFDLTQLRTALDFPVTFEETALYEGFGSAHNIVINEETGYAYAVGASGGESCGGGLHMINIQIPDLPRFVGCFTDTGAGRGYSHDAQCVVYHGPDTEHQGKEICIGANESALSIADVTDKRNPRAIARATYPLVAYVHQGWLTEDHRYFLQNDELDELSFGFNTRTLIWDFTDLDDPQLLTEYLGPVAAIDHNLYIRGHYAYLANYTSGLRIVDLSDIEHPQEVGYFDTTPNHSGASFEGAWSSYPFFESGVVVVSSRHEGLFVLQPTVVAGINVAAETVEVPGAFTVAPAYPNPFSTSTTLTVTLPAAQHIVVAVFDLLGRPVAHLYNGFAEAGTARFVLEDDSLPAGSYIARITSSGFTATQLFTRVR